MKGGDGVPGRSGSCAESGAVMVAGPFWRVSVLLFAIIPLGLLAVAALLTPDDRGLGTHQQLGLPPCSMRLLFGIRCPACGMTTSWSYFAQGQWISSLHSNIAGFLLALLAVCFAPISIRAAWTGRMPSSRIQLYAAFLLVAIGVVAITEWLTRLWVS